MIDNEYHCTHQFNARSESIELQYKINLIEQYKVGHFGESTSQFKSFQMEYHDDIRSQGQFQEGYTKVTVTMNFNEVYEISNYQGNVPRYLAALGTLVSILIIGYRAMLFGLHNKY